MFGCARMLIFVLPLYDVTESGSSAIREYVDSLKLTNNECDVKKTIFNHVSVYILYEKRCVCEKEINRKF